MFPRWLFDLLIVGALVLTALSAVSLLGLFYFDSRNKRLW